MTPAHEPTGAPAFVRALALFLLVAPALRAQGTIRGVVHDSLRANGPVAGAQVILVGTNRRAVADGRGRFEFTDVAPGIVTLAWWSPRLDSLALPMVEVAASVRSAAVTDVRLATPSLRSYQRAVCGVALASNDGIIVGEVRSPDGVVLAGVGVGARWHETLLGVGQVERRQRAALDTTNAAGFYALCGVPRDAEFAIVAGTDSVASGELVLGLGDAPVTRRDLIAAAATDVARVRGRLVGPDGRPVNGATVAIAGDTGVRARSDAEGRFTLENVPRRTTQFIARAIGLAPAVESRDVFDTELDLEDLRLGKLAQELSTVTVRGEPMTAGQLQFEVRRERGLGSFISDSQLVRLPVITAPSVASMTNKLTFQGTRQGPMLMMKRGGTWCRPRFYVDGHDNRNLDVAEEQSVLSRAKRIEVYTAAEAPPQFNDFDGCGAVVIWTL